MDTGTELLKMTLEVAVPLRIADLQRIPWDEIARKLPEWADVLVSQGDIIMYKSPKKGETAKAFNVLASALAAMSFVPGGVTFSGLHWEAKHPENA